MTQNPGMAASGVVPETPATVCRHCGVPIHRGIDFLTTRLAWLHAPFGNRYCGGWDEMREAAPALTPVADEPTVPDSDSPTYGDLRRKVANAHRHAHADPSTPDPWVSVRASELAALLEDVDALAAAADQPADCIDIVPPTPPVVLVLHTRHDGGVRFEVDSSRERLAWRPTPARNGGNVIGFEHVGAVLARVADLLDDALDDEQRPETD